MKNIKVLLFTVVILFAGKAYAQEAALQSEPIRSDAYEFKLPSYDIFGREKIVEKEPSALRDAIDHLPDFFKGATLKINLRNYYFSREEADDEPGDDDEKVSWAMGGSALLKTGKLYDVFSINTEAFTSQKWYGPDDKDGALLLEPGQDGYTVLGQLNPRFEYKNQLLSLYRQRHDFPYINSQDNRMTPNTFESYSYGYLGEGANPPWQIGFGYINKIKKRNSDEFISMSEGAGVADRERGMLWVGMRIKPNEENKIVAINYSGLDFLNMFYSDIEHTERLSEDWSFKSSVQFSEQRSIGDDLLTNESVSAVFWGMQHALSYQKFLIRAAVTANDDGMQMRSPFGTYPGYNSSIVEDFNRAGEVAWKFGISYDFSELDLEGLTAYADYISGNNASDDDGNALKDKREIDLNIDYKPGKGILKNFWLRVRSGFVHQETVGTAKDFRVILNYEIPII